MFKYFVMVFGFPKIIKLPPPNISLKTLGEPNCFGPTRIWEKQLKTSSTFLMRQQMMGNSDFATDDPIHFLYCLKHFYIK